MAENRDWEGCFVLQMSAVVPHENALKQPSFRINWCHDNRRFQTLLTSPLNERLPSRASPAHSEGGPLPFNPNEVSYCLLSKSTIMLPSFYKWRVFIRPSDNRIYIKTSSPRTVSMSPNLMSPTWFLLHLYAYQDDLWDMEYFSTLLEKKVLFIIK